MVIRSDIQQKAGDAARAKSAAKECLIAADKFLKDRQFDKAKQQVDKAKEIDPANPYISAFEERIKIFEEESRQKVTAEPKPSPAPPPAPAKPEAPAKPAAPAPKPQPVPTPKPTPPPPPKVESPAPAPVPAKGEPSPPNPAPSIPPPSPPPAVGSVQDAALKQQMEEMSRQIMELSTALLSERKTREDVTRKQLDHAMKQFRERLQKAWSVGSPKDEVVIELQDFGRSLGLDEDMVHSVTREVKLEMYGRAVKEMLAKRKLVRSSSSTMDWLRKVYQISMAEYLEYESRFLMDLVSDQFRGTLLLVAGTDAIRREVSTKMKSSGFAVVMAIAPEEALEKIERVSPTIIMTETQFPGRAVSGVMFLQLLRANPKFSYVPVMLLADEQEAVSLQSSELRETEGIITTPVDFDEMNAMINEKLAILRRTLSNL